MGRWLLSIPAPAADFFNFFFCVPLLLAELFPAPRGELLGAPSEPPTSTPWGWGLLSLQNSRLGPCAAGRGRGVLQIPPHPLAGAVAFVVPPGWLFLGEGEDWGWVPQDGDGTVISALGFCSQGGFWWRKPPSAASSPPALGVPARAPGPALLGVFFEFPLSPVLWG